MAVNPTIPKPDVDKLVVGATHTVRAVAIGARNVIYFSDQSTVTFSVGPPSWLTSVSLSTALHNDTIPGEVVVQAGAEDADGIIVGVFGTEEDLAAVRTAITHIYPGERNPGDRATLRGIYRHLLQRSAEGDS